MLGEEEAIRKNPAIDEPSVTIQTLSTNLVKQQYDIHVRLRKTNQITIEQSKDAVLQQLKAKLLHEDYSESLLQQDTRYRHYANNLERIVVKDEILTRQYFDETGNVKYHQILLPQTYSRKCSNPYMGQLINILESQKRCKKSDRGNSTLAWQNMLKSG